jgi:integrase
MDRKARVWTVPAERMKAGKEHRVPLATALWPSSTRPRSFVAAISCPELPSG